VELRASGREFKGRWKYGYGRRCKLEQDRT
jgi:hypothetical protein